jgi:membrane fusion protein, multidrug efflux system
MPAPDRTPGTPDRPDRRRRALLIGALLAAGTLALAVVTRGNGHPTNRQPGPTVVAQTRDLATTLTASGTLRRSSEHTVAYASPLASTSGGSSQGQEGNSVGQGEGGSGAPSATLTGLLDVGATASRGVVLYTADAQPVIALIGDLPAWRTLREGADDGADVRQLEENLVALGYGAGLVVDETFTSATAAAVRTWETDLGRDAPDGEVSLGDVVFLTAPGDVLGHEAAVRDSLGVGSPVLTIGSAQRVVVADVDSIDAGGWTAGSTVEVEWADATRSEGTVFGLGREVTDGYVELIVAIGAGDTGAGERRSGAAATITLVDTRRDGAIAVPIAAVVDDAGSPAVRVAQADVRDHLVPVETGLVADGWVEITAGLDSGEKVRLPG